LTAKQEAEEDELDEDDVFTDPELAEREAEDDSVVSV